MYLSINQVLGRHHETPSIDLANLALLVKAAVVINKHMHCVRCVWKLSVWVNSIILGCSRHPGGAGNTILIIIQVNSLLLCFGRNHCGNDV